MTDDKQTTLAPALLDLNAMHRRAIAEKARGDAYRGVLLHLANEILKCVPTGGMQTNGPRLVAPGQALSLLREIRNQVEALEGCSLEDACNRWNEETFGG